MKCSECGTENPEDMNFCKNHLMNMQETNRLMEARKWPGTIQTIWMDAYDDSIRPQAGYEGAAS